MTSGPKTEAQRPKCRGPSSPALAGGPSPTLVHTPDTRTAGPPSLQAAAFPLTPAELSGPQGKVPDVPRRPQRHSTPPKVVPEPPQNSSSDLSCHEPLSLPPPISLQQNLRILLRPPDNYGDIPS